LDTAILVETPLDFDPLSADAIRFVPMDFGMHNAPVWQLHPGTTLQFTAELSFALSYEFLVTATLSTLGNRADIRD
jgi:hypothetical protein